MRVFSVILVLVAIYTGVEFVEAVLALDGYTVLVSVAFLGLCAISAFQIATQIAKDRKEFLLSKKARKQ